MSNRLALLISLALCALLLSYEFTDKERPPQVPAAEAPQVDEQAAPQPPAAPLMEDFEGKPQLSLFPRLGSYRPEQDSDKLPFWNSYILHLQKTSGVLRNEQSGNQFFTFRTIRGLDSVGFFSPLAVSPNTRYQVSLRLSVDLPPGGSAGVGVIEYDQFYWLAEQYPESFDQLHRTGNHTGIRLTESAAWQKLSFRFTTGPETHMIHLVLFREGEANRAPVLVDDIALQLD